MDESAARRKLNALLLELEEPVSPKQKMKRMHEFFQEVSLCANKEDLVDALIVSIEPSDWGAKIVKIEMTNAFHRSSFLLDCILSGEKILQQRVVRFKWLFRSGSSLLSNPKYLLEHFFPKVSYCIRTKVIHRLGKYLKDEKLSEILFKLIESNYGWTNALPLLLSSSIEFIKTRMNDKRFILSSQQLFYLATRRPTLAVEFIKSYYSNLKCMESFESCNASIKQDQENVKLPNQALKYLLSKSHSTLVIETFLLYSNFISITSTRRITKTLLKEHKGIVLENPMCFVNVLQRKETVRLLSVLEYQHFLSSLLPEWGKMEMEDAVSPFTYWLRAVPREKQWDTFKLAWEKRYEEPILNAGNQIVLKFMDILPQIERENWVSAQIRGIHSTKFCLVPHDFKHLEGYFMSFLSTEVSIPQLKMYLNQESDFTMREELMAHVVHTCWVNNDQVAMKSWCDYVLNHFQSEPSLVRSLLALIVDKWALSTLWSTDWKLWDKLLLLAVVEQIDMNVIEVSIHYKLLEQVKVEDLIAVFLKEKFRIQTNSSTWSPYFSNVGGEIQRQVMQLCIESFSSSFPLDIPLCTENFENSIEEIVLFTEELYAWNRRNRHFRNPFSVMNYPWLMSRLMEIGTIADEETVHRILIALQSDREAKETFFRHFLPVCADGTLLLYFLQRQPQVIVDNIDQILDSILQMRLIRLLCSFLNKIKLHFSQLEGIIVEKCLETAQDDNVHLTVRRNSIIILSHLWDSQNWLNMISFLCPTKTDLSIADEMNESTEMLEMRRVVAECAKNMSFPIMSLCTLRKFCVDDLRHFKMSLGFLYSVCLNSPQSECLTLLKEEMLERPLGVKKHAIKLICTISPKADLNKLLSYLWDNETHRVVRGLLFNEIFCLFLDQPTEEHWSLLVEAIKSLSLQDKIAIEQLSHLGYLHFIPPKYYSNYCEICWNTLKTAEDVPQEPNTNQHQSSESHSSQLTFAAVALPTMESLVKAMRLNITDLSANFLHNFLCTNLFSPQVQPIVSQLILLCVDSILSVESSEVMQIKLNAVQGIFDRMDRSNTKLLTELVLNTCAQALKMYFAGRFVNNVDIIAQVLSSIKNMLVRLYPQHSIFFEILRLDIAIIILRNAINPFTLAVAFTKLIDGNVFTYSSPVITLICDTTNELLKSCFDETELCNFSIALIESLVELNGQPSQEGAVANDSLLITSVEVKLFACQLLQLVVDHGRVVKSLKFKESIVHVQKLLSVDSNLVIQIAAGKLSF